MGYPKDIYLNGKIVRAEEAKISVFDRGFIFGDGLYEVMVQINGRFFYGDAHLKRLQTGLNAISLQYNVAELNTPIMKLLRANGLTGKDCLLYIQVTRGVAPRQHAYPKSSKPTVMMYAVAKQLPDINTVHALLVTAQDFRWSRCDIKTISLLGNVMLNQQAAENNCLETLLVRNGVYTEASHCNVFFVKNGVVRTHPANNLILKGITRQIVLELCEQLKIKVDETPVTIAEVYTMNEAFLTGTSTQVASIKKLDDHYFYQGNQVGPITQRIQEAFLQLKNGNR